MTFEQCCNEMVQRFIGMGYEVIEPPEPESDLRWLLRREPALCKVLILAGDHEFFELHFAVKEAVKRWGAGETPLRIGLFYAGQDKEFELLAEISSVGAIWQVQSGCLRRLCRDNRWEVEDSLIRRTLAKSFSAQSTEGDAFIFSKWPYCWSYLLIIINCLVFLAGIFLGGPDKPGVMWTLGAKDAPGLWLGEYWRLLTAAFYHFNFAHLFFNLIVLYLIGPDMERLFGGWRFLTLYFVGAVWGALTSVITAPYHITACASGGVFGLVGAYLYYRWRRPYLVRIKFTHVIWVSLGILVYLGTKAPEVGLAVPAGGFAAGFFTGGLLGIGPLDVPPYRRRWGMGLLAGTLALAILALYPPTSEWHIPFHRGRTVYYRIPARLDYAIGQFSLSYQRDKKNPVIGPVYLVPAYQTRGDFYFEHDEFAKAAADYRRGLAFVENWELRSSLGLAYYNMERRREALDQLKRAAKLNPKNKELREVIRRVEAEIP
ncbi:MAG TPA: rhomboid family intramembrane serine protease [Firmicutes bacterium]|nr:rhomboid family intramembrane serine protease [Bacillota bacterium]HOQ24334.1 rhomboid family intramembrane serine protease [Bacillota bacterium]HPT67494.1 rhomboid family intramembrane serine protease [Bacillota bacterium]